MCNFKSIVFDREMQPYYLPDNESHEAIISHYKLVDNDDNLCRVEIIPTNESLSHGEKIKYTLKIDEKKPPKWYDKKLGEFLAEEILRSHLEPEIFEHNGEKYIIVKRFQTWNKANHLKSVTVDGAEYSVELLDIDTLCAIPSSVILGQ